MARGKTKITVEVDAETRARIERITNPRDTPVSLLFRKDDVEAWKALAKEQGESFTSLIESAMNELRKRLGK